MKLARAISDLPDAGRPCLAIGFFDGVHLGHQQIIRQAVADARQHGATSIVLTFDVHPATVVAPDQAPSLIQTPEQRIASIAALGPDALLMLPFTRDFSRQPAADFINRLHGELRGIHGICIGANFHFGHRRTGNLSLLQEMGTKLGFSVHGVAAVGLDGTAISSTRIRQAIRDGRLDEAGQMLGRPWSLAGTVVHGERRGHSLGFPTANIEVPGLALPPFGVYAAQALAANVWHPAVVNLGVRPTVSPRTARPLLEAHLLDFSGDLYGQSLEVTPLTHLRGEQKFGGVHELREQIARDVAEARRALH